VSPDLTVAVAGVAVALGVCAQRITGMGFGLVAAPFLSMALGPHDGIGWTNGLAVLTSLTVLAGSWRDLDLRRAGWLCTAAALAVLPGTWLARQASSALLQLVIGLVVLVALVLVVGVKREDGDGRRRWPGGAMSAGGMSGFMGATAGVGGPALVLYAAATNWRPASFTPTAQVVFVTTGVAALATRGLPDVTPTLTASIALAMVCGALGGQLLARRVTPGRARTAALALAFAGSAAAAVTGAVGVT
jgi:uncharacterized protein